MASIAHPHSQTTSSSVATSTEHQDTASPHSPDRHSAQGNVSTTLNWLTGFSGLVNIIVVALSIAGLVIFQRAGREGYIPISNYTNDTPHPHIADIWDALAVVFAGLSLVLLGSVNWMFWTLCRPQIVPFLRLGASVTLWIVGVICIIAGLATKEDWMSGGHGRSSGPCYPADTYQTCSLAFQRDARAGTAILITLLVVVVVAIIALTIYYCLSRPRTKTTASVEMIEHGRDKEIREDGRA